MSEDHREPHTVGRYVLYGAIARGGMATVHLARLVGTGGFSRVVAAKRLHDHFTGDPEFIELFRNEARVASLIHHPNVVPVLDLVVCDSEVILVQEYVHGVALDRLFRAAVKASEPVAPDVVVAIAAGLLAGLHASHGTRDERGELLGIIHRDVTPHNVVVGEDGVPRLLDFGIAKARSNLQVTRQGVMKGKLTYMAPEQFRGESATPLVDVYAAGVVLWELLTLKRLHAGRDEIEVVTTSVKGDVPHLAGVVDAPWAKADPETVARLDRVVQRMTANEPAGRPATANAALEELLAALAPAPPKAVAAWVKKMGAEHLDRCRELLSANEDSWRRTPELIVESGEPRSTSGYELAQFAPPPDDPVATPPPNGPKLAWLVLAAAAAIALAFASFGLARRAGPAAAAPSPPPRASISIVTEAATASARASPSASQLGTASATAPPSPPPRAPLRHLAATPPRPHLDAAPSAPPTATAAADCDPPFVYEGTKKIFKPSCL